MTAPGVWVLGPADELPAGWVARATPVLLVRVPANELGALTARGDDDRFLGLAARGLTRAEIARELGVSPRTVDRRLAATRERLGVRTNAEAAVRLAEQGW